MSSLPANIRALIEPALNGDTIEEVEQRLSEKTAQLWATGRGALVTEIWGACLHVWLAGGNLRSLLSMREPLERLAREWGLSEVTIAGRLGWDRVLQNHGYVREGDVLRKVLS